MSLRQRILEEIAKLSATLDGFAKDVNRRLDEHDRRIDTLDGRTRPAPAPQWWQIAGPLASIAAVILSVAVLIQWNGR